MFQGISLVISATALLIAAAEAGLLARGAPRREARTWIILGIVLLFGAAQRVNLGLRATMGDGLPLPQGVEFTILFNTMGVAVVLGYLRPILVRYRAADVRRQQSDARFHRALSEASDPIAIIDANGTYTYVNDTGCTFFKYTREQILGRHFRDFIVDVEPGPRGTVARASQEGAASIEREILCGDGTRVPVDCDLITLGDGGILIIGHDLTARRQAALAQSRIQRLEAVSGLAAGVAHDFNNLLTIIRGAIELAAEYGTERVSLDGAVRATRRASSLAQELIRGRTQAITPCRCIACRRSRRRAFLRYERAARLLRDELPDACHRLRDRLGAGGVGEAHVALAERAEARARDDGHAHLVE